MWKTTSLVAQGENKLATLLTTRLLQMEKCNKFQRLMEAGHICGLFMSPDSFGIQEDCQHLSWNFFLLKQETDRKQFSVEGSFLSWQHVPMKEFIPSSSPGKVDSSFTSKTGKKKKCLPFSFSNIE